MPRRTPTIDRNRIRTQPARRRKSKLKARDEARPVAAGASVVEFLDSLPRMLGAADLNDVTRSDRATLSAEPRQPVRGTPVGAPVGAVGVGDARDDDELLSRVRELLRDEEIRRAELSELERAFGEFQGTGAEPARQQLLDYFRRVSAR